MYKCKNFNIICKKNDKKFVNYIIINKSNKKTIYRFQFNKVDYVDKYYNINKIKNNIIISKRQFEYYLLLNNLNVYGLSSKIYNFDEYNII
jgi:UV DNA damage repair endonuclease